MTVLDQRALDQLAELIGDDPSDLVDLMDSFLQDAETLVATLSPGSDLPAMARAAHTLKSNARDFGATDLAACCARLESDLKSGEPPSDLAEQLAAIGPLWAAVRAAIHQKIATMGVR